MRVLSSGYVLHVHPFQPWILQKSVCDRHFLDKKIDLLVAEPSPIKGTYVRVEHFWSHLFGVTLALKTINDPHLRSKRVRIMVWRCQLPVDTYRRLCVMVNWQVNQSKQEQSQESE